ncbi:MAG: ribosome recycling factor [Deltaproteobacteria bacterium]|nr:ribosome recycling factor [Deltaproteobacteria bacterium]
MMEQTVKELDGAFRRCIENFEKELARVRTGRANLALLDGIKVEYYGVPTPLNQVAALNVADPRLITIKPWEKKLISAIERAIAIADLGLTPSNDGDIVRLPIPALTTERRKELVKQVKRATEECKVAIRNTRREYRARLEKEEGVGEDDLKKTLDKVEKETERFIKDADTIATKKEKEIMDF